MRSEPVPETPEVVVPSLDVPEHGAEPRPYGDDPELDELWDACAAGDGTACDELYARAPLGSEYEQFGYTCGGRTSGGTTCAAGSDPDDEMPAGEIWQWALGGSIWDDPALADLASTMGPSSDSISMQPYGFQLDVDASGTVSAVLLFNDEVALGLPASDSSFSAYDGALPAGLSWGDTYDTIVRRYGEGALVTGGWGISYTFAYQTSDARYEIDVTFLANHEDELPGAPLHVVTLRALPG